MHNIPDLSSIILYKNIPNLWKNN